MPESGESPQVTGSPRATPGSEDSPSTRPQTSGRYRMLRVGLAVIRLGPVLILALLLIVMRFLSPVFWTTGNIGNVLAQTAAIAVLAIGQLLVILTRGIDLSVGSNLALSAVIGATVFSATGGSALTIAAMLGTGAAVGAVNGLVFVFGRLPHP